MRPTHVVIGADEYFIQNSSKAIPNNRVVNFYIACKLLPKNDALKNCLFGVVDAARADNRVTDPDKFTYSGYGIGFDHTGTYQYLELTCSCFKQNSKHSCIRQSIYSKD